MNSGSREFDFNTMADMGKQVSENKKALDDVRSSFVGPTQEEEAPPEPTPVILDGPATEEADNKVNLNELAYAAKRHLEEVGHPAADMLMTPANVKKLAEFESKRQRVERERLAYEEDPEGYDLNSANALDAYVKSWNLKNLTPEQRTGSSAGPAAEAAAASAEAIAKEVPRMAPDRSDRMSVDGGGSSGGEAPAPRRQSAGGAERPAPARSVPASKPAASPAPKGASKTNNGITTGPVNPRPKAEISGNFNRIVVPEKETGMASYEDPRMVAWSRGPGAAPTPEAPPSKVAQLPPDKRGKYSPDMSPSKAAALEAMGQMIPESIIPTAMAGAALKGGLPRKIAEKVETEMIPGVVNAGRKMIGKMSSKTPSLGEPQMKAATGKSPAIVREGSTTVGPRPEPRKINVDARDLSTGPVNPRPKAEVAPSSPNNKEAFTRPSTPRKAPEAPKPAAAAPKPKRASAPKKAETKPAAPKKDTKKKG